METRVPIWRMNWEFGVAAASEAAHWSLVKPLDRAQELIVE